MVDHRSYRCGKVTVLGDLHEGFSDPFRQSLVPKLSRAADGGGAEGRPVGVDAASMSWTGAAAAVVSAGVVVVAVPAGWWVDGRGAVHGGGMRVVIVGAIPSAWAWKMQPTAGLSGARQLLDDIPLRSSTPHFLGSSNVVEGDAIQACTGIEKSRMGSYFCCRSTFDGGVLGHRSSHFAAFGEGGFREGLTGGEQAFVLTACKFLDGQWCPKFTLIVDQKNHHTVFPAIT